MPWKWRGWFSGNGKCPFHNRVDPSITNVASGTSISNLNPRIGSRKKRSKSRSRPSMTDVSSLIMRDLPTTLKELECPLCKNTCVPPIYPCLNGHLLCSSCRTTTNKCPACSGQFSTTRNLFAEQFVLKYAQPCRYAKDGCIFLRWKGCDMKPHELGCFYRPIQCIVPSCVAPDKDFIRYRGLLEHLIETHKVHGTTRIPTVVNFQTDTEFLMVDRRWLPYYVQSHGCDFFLMLEARRPHFWAWVWVQPPKLAHNTNTASALPSTSPVTGLSGYGENFVFVSTLIFHNPDKFLSLKWSGPVHSIRTPASVIIQEGLCFGGSETFMQHFETTDKILTLTLNIEKKLLARTGSNTSSSGGSSTLTRRRSRSRPKSASRAPQLYPQIQDVNKGNGEAAALDQNNNSSIVPAHGATATPAAPAAAAAKPGVRFTGVEGG